VVKKKIFIAKNCSLRALIEVFTFTRVNVKEVLYEKNN